MTFTTTTDYETAALSGELAEWERRLDADGPGPRLWDAGEGVCCAAYQLGACCHTEADDAEFYAELEAEWRRENPEEAARQDAAHAAWLAEEEAREAARWGVEEPF